ncbi:hypothetical protein [Niallia sp. 01092]|uniref:hypothetical protein n=1 Tax=unclassified Niallia TaxID=2837522 RepID=UPI003FD5659C
MLEFLLDITTIPSYQTIYFTILVGLMVKYFWDWNLQTTVNENVIASESSINFQASIATININVQKYNSPILHWICKNIRKRTKSSADDPEKPNSSYLTI